MANQAAKKADKRGSTAQLILLPLILLINAVYLYFKIYADFENVGLWHAAGFVVTSALYWWSYKSIVESWRNASEADIHYDALALLASVQLTSTFYTEKAWFALLLVPVYMGWKAIELCRTFMGAMPSMPQAAADSAEPDTGRKGGRPKRA